MNPSRSVSSRRAFLRTSALLSATVLLPHRTRAVTPAPTLGQGDFRYRLVPGWGVLGAETPVNNCHGLARDREGHIILLTDDTTNNVIVYDRQGKLVHKWGQQFPGAHGLSLVTEGAREVLYLTDLKTHTVTKATLDGAVLQEWTWPQACGRYEKADQYRPSWTLHRATGEFFVLDGYGRDYIHQYSADGAWTRTFGGPEGGIVHWGPHGGMLDIGVRSEESLLIAMSDQQYLLRLSLDGRILGRFDLPGGNPRQVRRHGRHLVVAHLADNWPKDRDSRGFISVLDEQLRVISNIGGSAPAYSDDGRLQPMRQEGGVFTHPHDLLVDTDESLYVAQFSSGRTYPLKFERI